MSFIMISILKRKYLSQSKPGQTENKSFFLLFVVVAVVIVVISAPMQKTLWKMVMMTQKWEQNDFKSVEATRKKRVYEVQEQCCR